MNSFPLNKFIFILRLSIDANKFFEENCNDKAWHLGIVVNAKPIFYFITPELLFGVDGKYIIRVGLEVCTIEHF